MRTIADKRGENLAKVLTYYGLLSDTSDDEYKIVCPFHGDVNPSMKINLEDGSFFCFGCGLTGDAQKFVSLVNPKMSDLQACLELGKILKSDKVKMIDLSNRKPKKRGTKKQSWMMAHDYYYGLRTVDWKRDDEEEVESAASYMEQRGFFPNTLTRCHAKVTYNKQYPIIFPMLDNGKFKGWVCRTTSKEIEKRRKYLYNEGFSRATTLVGNYGGKSKVVILVEGYMDYLKMRQFGCKKVAAILGWKVTAEQIQKLKDAGVTHIVSALDNDECGRKGTKYLEKFFEVTRFQYESGCKDAGEMNRVSFGRMMNRTKKQFINDTKREASK